MIADDNGDLSFKFAGLMSLEEVKQAMREARREQRDLWNVIAEVNFKVHVKFLREWLELRRDLVARNLEIAHVPLEAGKKHAGLQIAVLVCLEDIAAVAVDKI